jgi:GH15 family glucan-1,4-alpha-glucosidase
MSKGINLTLTALDAIKRNATNGSSLIAAIDGPGTEHKEYLHVWPRDAILVAIELRHFDQVLAERIAGYIINLPTDQGLFYQRYELDGSPDPRAWCNHDNARQLDQDALRFVAISKFPGLRMDLEKIRESYTALLHQIKDKKTSTDVWEQKQGYFFYTTAALIWGLKSAEKIFGSKIEHEDILKELIGSIENFYDERLDSFVKSPSEKIIDLEVPLGLNILFESGLGIFNTREKLLRVLSTLRAVEKELCVNIGQIKIPIRYKEDFWNGECVGSKGSGRPWPMGVAIISQTYLHLAKSALEIGDFQIFRKALNSASNWMRQIKKIPGIDYFPEQIDFDGSLPNLVPKSLAWCAAEFIKAERMYTNVVRDFNSDTFQNN